VARVPQVLGELARVPSAAAWSPRAVTTTDMPVFGESPKLKLPSTETLRIGPPTRLWPSAIASP